MTTPRAPTPQPPAPSSLPTAHCPSPTPDSPQPSAPSHFASFAARITQLARSIETLAESARQLGVAPPQGREWFELVQRKLLPQCEGPPLLIVAIVGGTNIGKSAVFNHLAGETASASTPLAAGTKHPVCLVPPGCDDPALLARLFEDFQLRAWQSPADPLDDAPENRIYWRLGAHAPPRLVLVDAPDVDSDATVNWQRAKAIRQSADVLIALLTQQKYNDAAVKQFFRAAVEADKPIIVIFNFCDLAADRDYWPQWLARFSAETGAKPELVYVVPYDRAAAGALKLPFYRLERMKDEGGRMKAEGGSQDISLAPTSPHPGLPPESDGAAPHPSSLIPDSSSLIPHPSSLISHPSSFILPPSSPSDLRDELAGLHFDAIKIRTFRGALSRVLDPAHGLPRYLEEIRAAAAEFAAAASVISATEMARVAWPSLPSSVLVEELQSCWDADRTPWARRVHGFYRLAAAGLKRPIRAAWNAVAGVREDPLAAFQRQERTAVLVAVEKLLDELARLARVGNEILQPRLERILSGRSRAELLERVEEAHRGLPQVDDDYRTAVRAEFDAFKVNYPWVTRWLQGFDQALALARPAITVTLVVSGGVVAGNLVGQAAMHAAGHLAGHVAADTAITTGITEAVVSTTGEGARQAAARLFRRLQDRFAQARVEWLAGFLEKQLLGDLLAELRQGTGAPESLAFRKVEAAMADLGQDQH